MISSTSRKDGERESGSDMISFVLMLTCDFLKNWKVRNKNAKEPEAKMTRNKQGTVCFGCLDVYTS